MISLKNMVITIPCAFCPLMRTTIPFITGYTNYALQVFITYNSLGAITWGLGIGLVQVICSDKYQF